MSQVTHRSSSATNRFEVEQHFELPDRTPPHNEGQTVAAWFSMLGIIIGSAITTVGICMANTVVVAVGAIVIAAALVGGYLLRLAGYGQRTK